MNGMNDSAFTYGPLPLLARSGISIANIIHNFANII